MDIITKTGEIWSENAIGAVISQAMIEKEIDERLKNTEKSDDKETK